MYRQLARLSLLLGREDYAGRDGCAAYPYTTFPWEGK